MRNSSQNFLKKAAILRIGSWVVLLRYRPGRFRFAEHVAVAECALNVCCAPQVWVTAELDVTGNVRLQADSDSLLSRGLCAILVQALSGLPPSQILQVKSLSMRLRLTAFLHVRL